MSAFINVNKKRKELLEKIKKVYFEAPPKFQSKDDAKEYEEQLSSNIWDGCYKLYDVVNQKIRVSDGTSESCKYLKLIRDAILAIIPIHIIKLPEIKLPILKKLLTLQKVCETVGNAKFGKLTFGATLDYPNTLKEFRRLGQEIEELEDKVEKFLERKYS